MKTKIFQQLAEQIENFARQVARDEVYQQLNKQSFPDETTSSNNQEINNSHSPIGWLKGDDLLRLLYDLLYNHAFIICLFPEFKSHFLGSADKIEKILWKTTNVRLVYLFDLLYTFYFIHKCNAQYNQLLAHFILTKSKSPNSRNLCSALNSVRNSKKRKGCAVIDIIVDQLHEALKQSKGNINNK